MIYIKDQHVVFLIMLITSLFFVGGLLVYTRPYRRRGLLTDKLFFALEICCLFGLVGDAITIPYIFANHGLGMAMPDAVRSLTVFFEIFHEAFDGILVLYVLYVKTNDVALFKKCACVVTVVIAFITIYSRVIPEIMRLVAPNWESSLWQSQTLSTIHFVYHGLAIIMLVVMGKGIFLYYLLTMVTSFLMFWLSGWNETASMMNAQVLIYIHLFIMNSKFNGEDENVPIRI